MITININDNLRLKQYTMDDADELFAIVDQNRELLRNWLPWVDATQNPTDTANFIQSTINQAQSNKTPHFAIQENEKIVGSCGYHPIDWPNKTASYGYWLSESHQGQGIATLSSKALTNYAFESLDLNRIFVRAAVKNEKSRAIPERLGYTFEGINRQAEWLYDHYVDLAIYSLLKTEWLEYGI